MSSENMEVRMRNVEDTIARIQTKLNAALEYIFAHEKRFIPPMVKPEKPAGGEQDQTPRISRCLL